MSTRYLQRDIERLKGELARLLESHRLQLVTQTEIRKAVATKREQACAALLEACESAFLPLVGMYNPIAMRHEALRRFSAMLEKHGLYFDDEELRIVEIIRQAMANLTKAYTEAAEAGMTDAWLEEQKAKNYGGLSIPEGDPLGTHIDRLGAANAVLQTELKAARIMVRRILGIQA